MDEQKQLMSKVFLSEHKDFKKIEFEKRKLPLFGEKVSKYEIDFSWSIEDVVKKQRLN